MELIGRLAFYIGLVISLIAGWIDVGTAGLLALVVLGIIVGLLNITGRETGRFLIATLVLITAGLALAQVFGDVIARILYAYVTFTAGAALVVALKEVYSLQKD